MDEDTLLVYGGYAHRCVDYCDDFWIFSFQEKRWRELLKATEYTLTPGKRFKFATVSEGAKMFLFGGYRLWHGYASDNSMLNNWKSYEEVSKLV